MDSNGLEDPIIESADPLGGDYDSEDYGGIGGELDESYTDPLDDAEASFAARRARQMALRRSRALRAQRARGGYVPTSAPTPAAAVRRTQVAVREVDLARRVQADATSAALATQRRLIAQTQWAVASSVIGGALVRSVPEINKSPILAAGVSAVPLIFVKPPAGTRLYKNPQLVGLGAVAGATLFSELKRKSQVVSAVQIVRSERELPVSGALRFRADAVDENGRSIADKRKSISWKSSDPDVAHVDPTTGEVKALKPGFATITAIGESQDLFDQVGVRVTGSAQKS